VLRRLFERLQQSVERFAGEHVDFVDDVDFKATATGSDVDVAAELSNLFNSAIAGAIDFQNIDILATGDRLADVALVAGLRGWPFFAVEALGKDAGRRSFSRSSGTGEQVSVPNPLLQNRVAQRSDNVPLANQVTESLRPITPGDHRVRSLGVPGHASRSIAVEINPG
jgi:hypothetical protein